MIDWLHRGAGAIVDVIMAPLRLAPPLVGLTILALLTAVGLLLVFRVTINRARIETAKRRTHAAIFEMRLYQDDLRALLRAAGDVFVHNLTYLRAWLIPMLIVSLPLALLIAQVDSYYGFTGFTPNQSTLLIATTASPAEPHLRLEAPATVRVDTPPIWFPSARRVVWRLTPLSSGTFTLGVQGDATSDITMQVSDDVARRSSPLESLSLQYPARDVTVLGWHTYWLWPYLILTFVFAYALRRAFGVVF